MITPQVYQTLFSKWYNKFKGGVSLEKRKLFKLSVIVHTMSKAAYDQNIFYTSDTDLMLVFELLEKEYEYERAEIILYNEADKSFVTRGINKVGDSFVYQIESDIIQHHGEWVGQLQLSNNSEVYTSKPFQFNIENDLSTVSPPTLTDINNWSNLKNSANELIAEMRTVISENETAALAYQQSENVRSVNETGRKQAESTRENHETTRQNQERDRNANEENRKTKETERQNNEVVRLTNESERQSAELTRIENENLRNLTSVEEFIKLQDSIGGRNLVLDTSDTEFKEITITHSTSLASYNSGFKVEQNVTYAISMFVGDLPVPTLIEIGTGNQYGYLTHAQTAPMSLKPNQVNTFVVTFSGTISSYRALYVRFRASQADNTVVRFNKLKVTKGSMVYPYTKAPEDFTSVSKDDYYNYVKLINDFKDNQFNQLKQAVIALGGTI